MIQINIIQHTTIRVRNMFVKILKLLILSVLMSISKVSLLEINSYNDLKKKLCFWNGNLINIGVIFFKITFYVDTKILPYDFNYYSFIYSPIL